MKKILKQITISIKNPIIRNHVVYGKCILPGLAYIDLIYQVFKENGYSFQNLRLQNLSMHHPLSVGENDQTVLSIQCGEVDNGLWQITIEGQTDQNKLHVKAQILTVTPSSFDEILDIEQFKRSAQRVTDISDAYDQCRLQELVHTGFMKLQGLLYHADEGLLMDLSIGPEALASSGQFLFHPAIIDGSGVGSNTMLYSLLKGEQRLFVPLFYESFSASELIQKSCFARIKTSSLRYEGELIAMTVEFFNVSGAKIGELKNFTSKIVRKVDLINPERKNETPTAKENVKPSLKNESSDENILHFLSEIWAQYLKIPLEEVETEIGYYEMGLDSPGLLGIVEEINSKLGMNLAPTLLFEYSTISALASYLSPLAASQLRGLDTSENRALNVPRLVPVVGDDIAIIGIKGRYPKAKDLEEFWQNLLAGKDCISEIPPSRWDWKSLNGITSPSGKPISKWGGFIDDHDCFDAQFFRISPREAETMDPQERLFLETCWETIEDAGYTPKTLSPNHNVGVFVGVMHKDYTLIGAENLSKENVFTLSLNYAPIPNRVSYFCNFHGPSLAVDTVCSSSLTAVHLAVESLRLGECDIALAGGVNLSLHPNKYLTYGSNDMLSSDGYCHTFGKGGDGYVPAEGVGVVLLKPLRRAVEDGDQIYAVIKASSINHVGTVSGMTVPSPTAQAEVIEKCLEKTGIDPRTISYIEAHGTGTSLGDPIEIQGLVKAFSKYTKDKQFCSIGSLKSNMGHAESAAGISGLTKVALQLYHKTLVPSLHSEELNPYLDLPQTPFYVQHTTEPWNRPFPLRAGISSFGATGSNAHLILEEYRPLQRGSVVLKMAIVPLSAKNKQRLFAYAEKLLEFLHKEVNLFDLAYTLQVGRVEMEERVVFLVKDVAELIEKLKDFGKEKIPSNCWIGTVKKKTNQVLDSDDFKEIAQAWVKGAEIGWKKLYGTATPSRVRLPTYPFAKERYWIPEGIRKKNVDFIHPLVHKNTSDLTEQRFTSSFTGEEFFLADHVIKGRKILPAVAYLEMARAAAENAIREKKSIRLQEIVWLRPVIVEEHPVTIHIGLYPEEEIAFEIYGEEGVVYSQGKVEICDLQEPAPVNLEELQGSCDRYEILGKQCYATFRKMGLEYGPAHRGIEKIYVGKEKILAKLSITNLDGYVLHPGIMDSAFQASMGLKMDEDGSMIDGKLRLPFAIESVEIYGKCTESMWAYARYSQDVFSVEKADIDLYDDQGQICVRIKGLSSRELESSQTIETLFFEPIWIEQKEAPLEFQERKVIHCSLEGDFISQGLKVFDEIQTLLKSKLTHNLLVQVIVPTNDPRCLSALSGLLKTAHLENPYFHGQLVEVDSNFKNSTLPKTQVRHSKGKWTALEWKILKNSQFPSTKPWKDGGVYLITGGFGGLGWIFAKEIASQTKKATLILTGRSPLNEQMKAQLQELQQLGIKAIYSQTDVTDADAVKALIQTYPQLNGIIHSAGVLQDNFIIKKNKEEVEKVLAPKVLGTIHLDEASKELSLDFFILFSSGTGAVGNVGQADYAMANAFMNAYAEYRSTRRSGKTLSILWPLWKEGGMQVDAETAKRMKQTSGMVPMSTAAGIKAFYQAFASNKSQVIVVEGDAQKIQQFLQAENGLLPRETKDITKVSQDDFAEKTEDYFKKVLSSIIKLPSDRIDATAAMEDFGIDSVMIIQMTSQLEKVFGPLSKTLFFENQNIRDLTEYFIKNHSKKLVEELGGEKQLPSKRIESSSKVRERSRYLHQEVKQQSEIAIIGIAGRYPQADNLIEFWRNLTEGKDCITEIPRERWNHSLYFDEDKNKPGKTYSKWGGFLNDIDAFDPLFFHISPKDAELIDPQERLFLQCVYETLEDAGYTKENLQVNRSVGVYVGVMYEEYQLYGAQEQEKGKMIALSGNPSSIANRVSYFFNFHGMSVALDTMCSSSLTALHLACENLKQGGCEVAIAGGVNLSVHPNKYLMLGQGKFVSSKGRCESFGIGGDGYVPGEGVGAVLLKPLAKAIADGDHIYGIVKGTAVNHGGKTNGYSVPNPRAQADVIKGALEQAKVNPRAVSYIEAHGTGTSLGDPIEVAGLTKAFEEYTSDKQFCALGSAKSNIGHCESAAGIAGLTKVLLQIKYQKLVPSLHSKELNPNIAFENSPFVVQQELAEWKRPLLNAKEYPRIAGLSGFGAGGSNAHVIIEEYIPKGRARNAPNGSVIIVLSAESEEQLKVQAKRLLEGIGDQDLLDIAFTLQVGREAMTERLALIVDTMSELKEKLVAFGEGNSEGLFQGKRDKETVEVLLADEDMSKTIEAWIAKKKYPKIAKLWVKGMAVDWYKFYSNETPKRISLPTYPFAKQRYWIPQQSRKIEEENRSFCFLTKQWELCSTNLRKERMGTVLILTSKETTKLASELSKYFPKVIEVADFKRAEFDWKNIDGCIDLFGCGGKEEQSIHWIQWLQHLIDQGNRNGLMVLSVSKGLESFQNSSINLAGATRAGLVRMLQSEYSHLKSRHMDVDSSIEDPELAQLIADEYFSDNEEPEVCYRNGKRYRSLLEKISLPNSRRSTFSDRDVLLITGGTRGLGLLCAEHFVKNCGVKHLLLTGRTALPPRQQWNTQKDENTAQGKKIRALMALEKLGAQVTVVSNIEEIKKDIASIKGVIYCAGTTDQKNPAFIKKNIKDIERVLEPKIDDLNSIYQLLKDEPLEFFILFSSVSAIIPTLASGQSDYSMANAYMDYFAEAHRAECPIVSIQWPSWKETGMGEIKTKAYVQTGMQSLTNIEGLKLLDEIVGQTSKHYSVILPTVIDPKQFDPKQLMRSKSQKDWLIELLSKELKLEPSAFNVDKTFQEYGIDSIILAQILQQINQKVSANLDPSILYEYPTIRSFSAWLRKTYGPSEEIKVQLKEKPKQIPGDDIAVIGMSCRFAGADSVESFWELLAEGRSAIKPIPLSRWSSAFYAGLLDNATDFDPEFFNIPEEDAKGMDPQALLILEECLKLWYQAGYSHSEVKGRSIGVYIGGRSEHRPSASQLLQMRNPILAVGQNYLAANVSQFFDLRGPSVVLDTACSSALVAMNMAIQALRSGDIEAAVVGGVNFFENGAALRLFEQRGILCKEPTFHIFDQRSQGMILGEGVGVVFLKPLQQAVEDGDHIEAIIKAVAINNDGKTAGPATPSFESQKAVMHEALLKSGKKPEDITYIEANGSGSIVTDLLELKAIQSVYCPSGTSRQLGLGSIKPNIGHPLCAEGIASFIKVVLMLKQRQIVPFLSGTQEMEHFDQKAAQLYFSRKLASWSGSLPVAAINCFADGGTNAHLILEAGETAIGEKAHPLTSPELKKKPIFHFSSENRETSKPMFWKTTK